MASYILISNIALDKNKAEIDGAVASNINNHDLDLAMPPSAHKSKGITHY